MVTDPYILVLEESECVAVTVPIAIAQDILDSGEDQGIPHSVFPSHSVKYHFRSNRGK